MSPTHFCARYLVQINENLRKHYLQKVGQGHGVQFPKLHHSIANIKMYKRHLYFGFFAQV